MNIAEIIAFLSLGVAGFALYYSRLAMLESRRQANESRKQTNISKASTFLNAITTIHQTATGFEEKGKAADAAAITRMGLIMIRETYKKLDASEQEIYRPIILESLGGDEQKLKEFEKFLNSQTD